jgi:hypothetical protein
MTRNVHHAIEDNGDKVLDSHVRRVGSRPYECGNIRRDRGSAP